MSLHECAAAGFPMCAWRRAGSSCGISWLFGSQTRWRIGDASCLCPLSTPSPIQLRPSYGNKALTPKIYVVHREPMNLSVHHIRRTCRICGSRNLHSFLALGPTPLANAFLNSEAEFQLEARYPLDVYFCSDCTLVQLLDVIDPEVLFRNYNYVTGTSDAIAAHNLEYARSMVKRLNLQPTDLVVEVASNDGSLLKCFRPYGVRVLGVEPASNIVTLARKAGIETVNQFFNSAL